MNRTDIRPGNRTNRSVSIDHSLGKLPPQAIDLEEAVLGALMIERDALTAVVDILKPASFYKDAHQKIYSAILELFRESEPIDILTVSAKLRSNGELELIGGKVYIMELTSKVNSAANIEYHTRLIVESAIKREIIGVSSELQRNAFEDSTDVFELLDSAEQSLFKITESGIKKSYDNMGSLIRKTLVEMDLKKGNGTGLTGVPSGFTALDRLTSGWQKTELTILAARPGMGKCLGKGTKVIMFDGKLKNVEDIEVGELLMGPDSKPREVLSTTNGHENMYWIRQNKGIDYRVNESHIISLKRSRVEGGHTKGEVLNISVRDYLTKSGKFKSNYKGYKTSIEFSERELSIEPYFFGMWLGDGNSDGSARITKPDYEIVRYLNGYSKRLNLYFDDTSSDDRCPTWSITTRNDPSKKGTSLTNKIKSYNVHNGKFIPDDFLYNTRESRLQLLAGLLDSDGYMDESACGFEITQKSKRLSEQIKFLADTLGFGTSFHSKIAKIKSTGYECEVYRVRIWGDIDSIPTKIKRKMARKRLSKVDWRVTGIQVESDGIGEYFGFEIDGDHLFLLEDCTVTHNTAFVVSSLRNAAVEFNIPVAMFSLEMSSVQLVNRLISAEAEIDSEKIRKGQMELHEWDRMHLKIQRLHNAPIFIDDTPALSILELRAKCRRLKAQHDIQMIVIDYLQLMTADSGGKGAGNREQEIAMISRSLKNLAKELDVPVIALSQLSRAVETRGGEKRPQLSDLRESGSIEQDADVVMFLYRPEYYGITEDDAGNSVLGTGDVILAKNRSGSLDTVKLKFTGKYTKFSDLDAAFQPAFDSSSPKSMDPEAQRIHNYQRNDVFNNIEPPF